MDLGRPVSPRHTIRNHSLSPGGLPWIPWRWIRQRHRPAAVEALSALFDAYHLVHSRLDVENLCTNPPPERESRCRRCGACCAELMPEPVPGSRVEQWKGASVLTHHFVVPINEEPWRGRFYTGWYFGGVRLRMCPLMFRDPVSGLKICVVYHLGPGSRPPGCEGFRPNWPHCEVSQRPLVP